MLNRDYTSEMIKCNTGIFLHITQYYSNFVAPNTPKKSVFYTYIRRSHVPTPA